MNFCDYINSLRLAEAEKILNNKSYTITEIAGMSGFSTIRTFNRAFLKKYGISPSAYRKQLSEK
jgi:AraC-like DNA-binding protein